MKFIITSDWTLNVHVETNNNMITINYKKESKTFSRDADWEEGQEKIWIHVYTVKKEYWTKHYHGTDYVKVVWVHVCVRERTMCVWHLLQPLLHHYSAVKIEHADKFSCPWIASDSTVSLFRPQVVSTFYVYQFEGLICLPFSTSSVSLFLFILF